MPRRWTDDGKQFRELIMAHQLRGRLAVGLIAVTCLSALPAAQAAEDVFATPFVGLGGSGGRPPAPPPIRMPFANDGAAQDFPPRAETPRARVSSGGGQAWCVRSCDGRYFPLSVSGDQSAATCHSFCPASETTVVHGSSIDGAATESGKSYSELPNAFRYRNELVAGCTCNGHDQVGLAPIKIDDDPTIRKGDIVAGADGLMVANRTAGSHAAQNFSPASSELRARYRRVPLVAAE
jgi:Protein of unknown function (DUF2865)